MKNLAFPFFFFLALSSFGAEFFNGTYDYSTRGEHILTTVKSVPCTVSYTLTGSTGSRLSIPSFGVVTVYGTDSDSNNGTVTGQSVIQSSSAVGQPISLWVQDHGGATNLVTSITVHYGTPVDPENPDNPDNPDNPVNPDNPDNPSGTGPWALESTLQRTNSTLNNIGSGLSNWSSWQKNTAYPEILRYIDNVRSNIVQQLMNNGSLLSDGILEMNRNFLNTGTKIDSVNTGLVNIKSTLDTTNSRIQNVKNTLDSTNSGITNVKNTLDTTNSRIQNVKNTLDTTNSHLNNVRSNTSETVGKLRDIQDFLESGDLPSQPDQLESLPASTQFVNAVKHKLLPSGSFFSPSGDQWLSWTITFPLSSFGLEDMSFTLGGSSWSTVADGSLLTLMSVIRTLSKFAFYLLFLQGVIKALRQW